MFLTTAGLAGPLLHGVVLLAYLDPGTGSFALQMILAGLFGGLFAMKQSWAGLKLRASAWLGHGHGKGGIRDHHLSQAKRPIVHGRPNPRA